MRRAVHPKKRVRSDRGIAIILFTVVAALLLAFIGLAIDVGHLQWLQQRAQTAADSAVYAAMITINKGGSQSDAETAGRADAALNGFNNGVDGVTVAINSPPSGRLAGDSGAVEAVVRRTGTNFFLGFAGRETNAVSARAVATVGNSGGCVYALNPTAYRAFQIAGSNQTYIRCGVNVKSTNGEAFSMEGSGTLYIGVNASVGVVGGWEFNGQTSLRETPSGVMRDPVHVDSVSDPLAYVPAPSMAGLVVRSMSAANYDMNSRPAGGNMWPGIYCGGMRVGNTGSETFVMQPGVYVMAGGGFDFNSQAKISGTGVTIYNTTGAASGVPGCNASFSPFSINGQAEVTLSAPTNGSLEGIVIFQDRSVVSSSNNTINGGATTHFNGAIYLKNSPLHFSGNNSSGGYLIMVADTIRINGNSTVNADYDDLEHGSPMKGRSVLAE